MVDNKSFSCFRDDHQICQKGSHSFSNRCLVKGLVWHSLSQVSKREKNIKDSQKKWLRTLKSRGLILYDEKSPLHQETYGKNSFTKLYIIYIFNSFKFYIQIYLKSYLYFILLYRKKIEKIKIANIDSF